MILSQLVEEIPAESCGGKKNDLHQAGSFFGDLLADTQISLSDSKWSSRGPSWHSTDTSQHNKRLGAPMGLCYQAGPAFRNLRKWWCIMIFAHSKTYNDDCVTILQVTWLRQPIATYYSVSIFIFPSLIHFQKTNCFCLRSPFLRKKKITWF